MKIRVGIAGRGKPLQPPFPNSRIIEIKIGVSAAGIARGDIIHDLNHGLLIDATVGGADQYARVREVLGIERYSVQILKPSEGRDCRRPSAGRRWRAVAVRISSS